MGQLEENLRQTTEELNDNINKLEMLAKLAEQYSKEKESLSNKREDNYSNEEKNINANKEYN